MKKTPLLLIFLLFGCSSSPPPDFIWSEINVFCNEKCPKKQKFIQKLSNVSQNYQKSWELWQKYDFVFDERQFCRQGYYFFQFQGENCPENTLPVYGSTKHDKKVVWLWYPRWEDAIDWEAQLVIAEHYLPGSNEAQKIKWITNNAE